MPSRLVIAFHSPTRNIQWVGNKLVLSGEPLNRSRILSQDGILTAAGNRLVQLGWAPPDEVVHPGMPTQLRGKREYVTLPSGREAMTRRWKIMPGR